MTIMVVLVLLLAVTQCGALDVSKGSRAFGAGWINSAQLTSILDSSFSCDVGTDLIAFTGMSRDEVTRRLMRRDRHHFALEHAFRNPRSQRELTWYYRGSISYLFANAVHVVPLSVRHLSSSPALAPVYSPVLDFSGGVGTNTVWLAQRGFTVHYFGIGMAEMEFTRFRIERRQLDEYVKFIRPFAQQGGADKRWQFDAINSLPAVPTFRTMLLFDVLEHIPDYDVLVARLVRCLLPGGTMIVNAPFNAASTSATDIHIREHVPMARAMGSSMRIVEPPAGVRDVYWQKDKQA